MPRALLLSGVSGVGKSTVADAAGALLSSAGAVTAVVDTDALAQFGPAPSGRPDFHDQLKCANLAAVWATYRQAGAAFIVVAGVVETAELRAEFLSALSGCEVQTVRLVDKKSAPEEGEAATDFTVVNDRPVDAVAREVVALAGWLELLEA